MKDDCFVILPSAHPTVASMVASFDSLIGQLKQKDPNASAKVIWGDEKRLDIRIQKTCSHCNENMSVEQQDLTITWDIKPETNVKNLISYIHQVNCHLYSWFNGRKMHDVSFSCDGATFTVKKLAERAAGHVLPFRQPDKKLLLIDGSNVLSMAYFATATQGEDKLMRNDSGLYTNAVFGMVRKIFGLLRNYNPTHLAIAWDVDRETFRRELYAGYKGGRSETPEPLKEQFKTAQKLFKRMGIRQFGLKGYEADDLIGTVARQWQESGEHKCYIVSGDKDLYQLLAPSVTLIRPTRKGDTVYSLTDFEKEYEMRPAQWIDVKAILGESGASSDGIPGVKGCGEKAAIPLIQQFGSLDGVYAALETLSDTSFKRYVKKLQEGQEMAYLSRKLATIVTDVPDLQGVSIEELSLSINEKQMRYDFQSLGFRSLLRELEEGKYRVS